MNALTAVCAVVGLNAYGQERLLGLYHAPPDAERERQWLPYNRWSLYQTNW